MLSEVLRLIRVYHDLNQKELAEKLKISKSYLSEIESGTKAPTLQLIESYAAEFEIPTSAILLFQENLGGQGSPSSKATRSVKSKILRILQFIEERAAQKNEKKKSKLRP
jgi:transcriptional regulator with XRE-family HTH domain